MIDESRSQLPVAITDDGLAYLIRMHAENIQDSWNGLTFAPAYLAAVQSGNQAAAAQVVDEVAAFAPRVPLMSGYQELTKPMVAAVLAELAAELVEHGVIVQPAGATPTARQVADNARQELFAARATTASDRTAGVQAAASDKPSLPARPATGPRHTARATRAGRSSH